MHLLTLGTTPVLQLNAWCLTRRIDRFFFRCWSPVGRQYWMTGVGQELSVGNGCNHKGTILHELMHALGFWHEQSRPDRNLYVEVLWENIEQSKLGNGQKIGRAGSRFGNVMRALTLL